MVDMSTISRITDHLTVIDLAVNGPRAPQGIVLSQQIKILVQLQGPVPGSPGSLD